MLIWCLKQVKDFILKFPISKQNKVHKIIKCAMYSTIFSPSGEGVDDALVRLSLIEQIIKDVNLMCNFIQCQTSTEISGIVNGFAQYVRNYFQYVYIPI